MEHIHEAETSLEVVPVFGERFSIFTLYFDESVSGDSDMQACSKGNLIIADLGTFTRDTCTCEQKRHRFGVILHVFQPHGEVQTHDGRVV